VAGQAAASLGVDVWEHARRIWGRLHPKVEEKPAAIAVVQAVAVDPADPRALGALESQLEALLRSDTSLADDLERLWTRAAGAVVASGDRAVAVRGNVGGSIVTGDGDTIGR
jgi:hypothetical protein